MPKWRTRPPKYETAEEMQTIIEEYFAECEESGEIPSVTGLAYTLDLDRQSLINYENSLTNGKLKSIEDSEKAKIVDTIKRAKRYIENNYEQSLFNKNSATGAIFTLKNNYAWVDKQEVVNTNSSDSMSKEDIEKRLKELQE